MSRIFLHFPSNDIQSFPTFKARIAFSTAITITPTSANIASHIPVKPSALNARQANLTVNANIIF